MSDPLILLAGGASVRMGTLKGLIEINRRTWLEFQLERILQSGIRRVILVLGHGADRYYEKSPWLTIANRSPGVEVSVVKNPQPDRGSFSSIQTGIAALPSGCDGTFILPVDVPMAAPGTLETLRNSAQKAIAVVPAFGGRGGHPVWIARRFSDEILKMDPTLDSSRLDFVIRNLAPEERKLVPVDDPAVILNVNTPADLALFKDQFNEP